MVGTLAVSRVESADAVVRTPAAGITATSSPVPGNVALRAMDAAEVLHPVTAFRAHPMDAVVSTTCRGTASGIAFGCFYFFYAGEVDEIRFLGVNLIAFMFAARRRATTAFERDWPAIRSTSR